MILWNDQYLKALEADFLSEYHIDIRDLWRGKLNFIRAARLTAALLQKDSRLVRLVGEVRLSQTDSLLIDILDQLNGIRYYTAVEASKGTGKQWYSITAKAPGQIQKPTNREKAPEKKVELTRGKDLRFALNRMMNRALTRSVLGR